MTHLEEFEKLLAEFPIGSTALAEQWKKMADLRSRVFDATRDAGGHKHGEQWIRQLRAIALALDDFHRAVKHCEQDTDPDDDIPFGGRRVARVVR